MMDALESGMREARADGPSDRTDLKAFLGCFRARIDEFSGDAPQFDDLTMMCVEYRGSDAAGPTADRSCEEEGNDDGGKKS